MKEPIASTATTLPTLIVLAVPWPKEKEKRKKVRSKKKNKNKKETELNSNRHLYQRSNKRSISRLSHTQTITLAIM